MPQTCWIAMPASEAGSDLVVDFVRELGTCGVADKVSFLSQVSCETGCRVLGKVGGFD